MTQQFLKDQSMECHETALKIDGVYGLVFLQGKKINISYGTWFKSLLMFQRVENQAQETSFLM